MLAWMLAIALAGVPAGVDLNDIDHWEDNAERVLDGPAGCWEVVGHATWDWDAGRWGASRGDTIFVSRMRDGIWGPFHLEPLGEVVRKRRFGVEEQVYDFEIRFVPMLGQFDGDMVVSNDKTPPKLQNQPVDPKEEARKERQQTKDEERRERRRERKGEQDEGPQNVLRAAMDELSGSTSSWAQWDDERRNVVLYRAVPIENSGKEAEQTFAFPEGGQPVSMQVVFPDNFYRGSMPRVRISDAKVNVAVRPTQGELFPATEAFKFEVGIFGFTITGAQTIRYKSIRRCPIPALPTGDAIEL